ncbi:hypothetical protein, partial [Salipiger bermudensis]|uniref:hypothetical protein n=1 Tax=Salipiger bermudensis TaxID=344736 RepID=UPI001CD56228
GRKIMNIVTRIFGSIDRRYLIRAYLIGLAFFAFFFLISRDTPSEDLPTGMVTIMAINTLLFPFAKLVWDQTRDFAMGNTVVFSPAWYLFVMKYLVNGFLWALALFVAPLGIGYLWFKTRA